MKNVIRYLLPILLLACSALPAQAADLRSAGLPSSTQLADLAGCSRVDIAAVNAGFEQEVVDLVNQNRWNNGQLPPLKRNPLLDLAARYHAKDMSDDNYFDHDSYDNVGGLTWVCSWSTRIKLWYPANSYLAENIAVGQSAPGYVVYDWMNSIGHRNNILSTYNREIGVGYSTGNYWVQDFGSISSVYPLVINREAAQTSSNQVNLYVYGDSYQFPSMRFKNDGENWSEWLPFSNDAAWSLRQANGLRTVTVELRRANGTTVQSSDDIALNIPYILGGIPDQLTFIFDQSSQKWTPSSFTIQPSNLGGTGTLTWRADKSCNWISLNQMNGISPINSLQVSVAIDTAVPGIYDGVLTISVDAPLGTLGAPKSIPVHVAVVTNFSPRAFLPLATH